MMEKLFRVNPQKLLRASQLPDGEQLLKSILENNEKVTNMTKLYFSEVMVIKCKNKPRNMPLFGVFWEDYTDTRQEVIDLKQYALELDRELQTGESHAKIQG